ILAALKSGELAGVILAGVDLADLPAGAREALDAASFVLSLEVRESEASALADVVLPVAPPSEKGGSYVNWEGRIRPFGQALTSVAKPDRVVLNDLAEECDIDLGLPTLADAVREVTSFFGYTGPRLKAPEEQAILLEPLAPGQARLASWKLMLGTDSLVTAEPTLAGAARAPYAVVSESTARSAGLTGSRLVITTNSGSVELPFRVDKQIPDAVVWIPQNSQGCTLAGLDASVGQTVTLSSLLEVAQ
ncbi:MAG: NADH-quinone oxidoreductase subunit G, partial [Actinomycetaceae bacterium]|nr:NADH-quinone oxidoreductase subunit G [Actinomycetaceae bacterium]